MNINIYLVIKFVRATRATTQLVSQLSITKYNNNIEQSYNVYINEFIINTAIENSRKFIDLD
jgi:hypothetical protein